MPVTYASPNSWIRWYDDAGATYATATTTLTVPTLRWITNATSSSATSPWSARLLWSDGSTAWLTAETWTTPVMQGRSFNPARAYVSRRSAAQAAEDELRHYYEMEQRRQAVQLREQHAQAARDRSRELLLAHLTPAQRETFERNKWFIVEGGLSKQRYRIRSIGHMVANIDVLEQPKDFTLSPSVDGETVTHRLCGHCDINEVPLYDQLLAQKMMLELDEERFLRVANRHRAIG